MEPLTFIVSIAILIMSVVLHELSHGYVAELLGDPTPRLQGRLTINPIRHLDPFGSVIVPIITSFLGFTFGWAKPVEWNPYNVKNKRLGEFLISIAGPASNILVAVVFGLLIRGGVADISSAFAGISAYIVQINLVLAVFNLVPVPPLDGSKILFSLLPPKYAFIRSAIERNALILIVVLLFVFWQFIEPVIPWLFSLLTGV
jgi:Zn-dependent protease